MPWRVRLNDLLGVTALRVSPLGQSFFDVGKVLPHSSQVLWIDERAKLSGDNVQFDLARACNQLNEAVHLGGSVVKALGCLRKLSEAFFRANTKLEDPILDPCGSCTERCFQVATRVGLEGGRGHASQIGRQLDRARSVVENVGSLPSERAHEETKLEQNVVSRGGRRVISACQKIIRTEHEDGKVKVVQRTDERFKRALTKAEHTLAPDGDLTRVVEQHLQGLCDTQALR